MSDRYTNVRIERDLMGLIKKLADDAQMTRQGYLNRVLRGYLGAYPVPPLRHVATGELVVTLQRLAHALAEEKAAACEHRPFTVRSRDGIGENVICLECGEELAPDETE